MSPVTAAVSGAPQQPEIPSSVSTVMTASVSTSTRRAAVTKGAGSGCDRTAAVIAIMRKASSRSLLSVRNAAKPKKTAHRRVCFQTERPADGLFFRTYFSYGHFIIYYIPAEIKWSYKKAPHALGATVLSQDLGEGGGKTAAMSVPNRPADMEGRHILDKRFRRAPARVRTGGQSGQQHAVRCPAGRPDR